MAAIGFVLDRFVGITIPLLGSNVGLSVNLSYVPIMFSGFVFGPVWGAVVGAVSDLLGAFLMPQGAYFFGFTLTNALVGASAGLLAFIFRKKRPGVLALAVYSFLVSVFSSLLNSLWLSIMFKSKTFWVWAGTRLPSVIINTPVYLLFLWLIIWKLIPILKKNNLLS